MMITNFEVHADSAGSAREMAVNQAKAMGYTRIEAVFTTPLGDRRFRVQMTVSQ
jgi:ketol-acid reductoisomerase